MLHLARPSVALCQVAFCMTHLKLFSAVLAVAFGVVTSMAQTTVTNVFSGVNKVIPDGSTVGVSDTQILNFTNANFTYITDLSVMLTISGGYNGDFYGYLVHDTGFSVLLNRAGRTAGSGTGYSDTGLDVVFHDSGNDVHLYRDFSFNLNLDGQLTGVWSPDGRNVDPAVVVDTDSRTSLLGSFAGLDPNGSWTLFLADLDFGEQGTLVNWGLAVTAIPEPGTGALLLLGAIALGAQAMRRRRSR
jgi:hypothetical protein